MLLPGPPDMTSKTRRPVSKVPRSGEQRFAPSPVHDDHLRHAVGGVRKAGKGQLEYLTVSMTEALISSFPSDS